MSGIVVKAVVGATVSIGGVDYEVLRIDRIGSMTSLRLGPVESKPKFKVGDWVVGESLGVVNDPDPTGKAVRVTSAENGSCWIQLEGYGRRRWSASSFRPATLEEIAVATLPEGYRIMGDAETLTKECMFYGIRYQKWLETTNTGKTVADSKSICRDWDPGRIYITPIARPLDYTDDLVGRKVIKRGSKNRTLVSEQNETGVVIAGVKISYEAFAKDYTFLDGSACTK